MLSLEIDSHSDSDKLLLRFCLECFESANQLELCRAFNGAILKAWIDVFTQVIKAKVKHQSQATNKWERKIDLDTALDWKLKKICFRTLTRYLHHCNNLEEAVNDPIKKESAEYFVKEAFLKVFKETGTSLPDAFEQISMETHCFMIRFLTKALSNPYLRELLKPNLANIFEGIGLMILNPGPYTLVFLEDENYLLHISETSSLDADPYKLYTIFDQFASQVASIDIKIMYPPTEISSDESLVMIVSAVIAIASSLNNIAELPAEIDALFRKEIIRRLRDPGALHPYILHLLINALVKYLSHLSEETNAILFDEQAGTSIFSNLIKNIFTQRQNSKVLVYLALALTSTALSLEKLACLPEDVAYTMMMAVISDETLSSLPTAISYMQAVISINKKVMDQCAPQMIERLLEKWHKLGMAVSDESQARASKLELEVGRDTCLETVINIVKEVKLPPAFQIKITQAATQAAFLCLEDKDKICFERCMQLIGITLATTYENLPEETIRLFPLICYIFTGWPSAQQEIMSQNDDRFKLLLPWWSESDTRFESLISFFRCFLQQADSRFVQMADQFGNSLGSLLVKACLQAGMKAIAEKNNWELVAVFKVLTSMMEMVDNMDDCLIRQMVEAVKALLAQGGPSRIIMMSAFRFSCTFIWSYFDRLAEFSTFFGEAIGLLGQKGELLIAAQASDRNLALLATARLLAASIDFTIVDVSCYAGLLRTCIKILKANDDDDDDQWNEDGVFAEAPADDNQEEQKDEDIQDFWDIDECSNDDNDYRSSNKLARTDGPRELKKALYDLKNSSIDLLVLRTSGLTADERTLLQSLIDRPVTE